MTGPRRPALDPSLGFTLLELVLVMLIGCTALAIAAPSLGGFWRGSQSQDAASTIVSLTRWARSQAAVDARIHCLRFDPQSGTYCLLGASGQGYVPLGCEFGRVFTLPEECRVEVILVAGSEPNCIRFYPDRRADVARIRLVGPGSEEIEVAALSPTESYEIVRYEEASRWR